MVAALREFDEDYMLERGLHLGNHRLVGSQVTNLRRFKCLYGASPATVADLWEDLGQTASAEARRSPNAKLDHLFCALHFLKAYPKEHNLAGKFGRNEKTVRNWVHEYVTKIALLKSEKVCNVQVRVPRSSSVLQYCASCCFLCRDA